MYNNKNKFEYKSLNVICNKIMVCQICISFLKDNNFRISLKHYAILFFNMLVLRLILNLKSIIII